MRKDTSRARLTKWPINMKRMAKMEKWEEKKSGRELDFPSSSAVKSLPAMQERQETWVRKIPWSRAWPPTEVFLLGKSHGERNLVDYIQSMGSQSWTQLSDRACAHRQELAAQEVLVEEAGVRKLSIDVEYRCKPSCVIFTQEITAARMTNYVQQSGSVSET